MVATRDAVFSRVTADHVLKGGTRITWRLNQEFLATAPAPLTFQLQLGESGIADADDWADVGDAADDVVFLLDEEAVQRDFSVHPTSHYRVKLTTAFDTYFSPPVGVYGRLHRNDWLEARAIVRRENLRNKVRAGAYGWLFKRRKRTAPVTDPGVVDMLTGEVTRTINTAGVGTELLGGYFAPAAFMVDFTPNERYARRSEQQGHVDDTMQLGRAIAFPELDHGDVWVSATGDARHAIHRVRTVAAIRNVPIVVAVEMKLLSPTDPIYELPLPEVPPLQTLGREEF